MQSPGFWALDPCNQPQGAFPWLIPTCYSDLSSNVTSSRETPRDLSEEAGCFAALVIAANLHLGSTTLSACQCCICVLHLLNTNTYYLWDAIMSICLDPAWACVGAHLSLLDLLWLPCHCILCPSRACLLQNILWTAVRITSQTSRSRWSSCLPYLRPESPFTGKTN